MSSCSLSSLHGFVVKIVFSVFVFIKDVSTIYTVSNTVNMSVEDLNLIIEQYMESEIECCKSRKIYSALENIVIRKDYLQNLDPISKLDEMKISDSTSNSRLLKNKSLTKVTNVNKSKNAHTSTPDNKQFILVQKQIQQFESYKNCINRVSDKYCTEFLHLLEVQNRKLSQSTKSKQDG